MTTNPFRERLQAAVMERHCVNHPLTEKWAEGKLSRNAMMGWAIEHWHWVSKMPQAAFYICAKARKIPLSSTLVQNRSREVRYEHVRWGYSIRAK